MVINGYHWTQDTSKLQTLVEQYVDYRTEQEYGISTFGYWYYQVQ